MRRADGFSLLELLVAMTIAAVVGTVLFGTLTAQLRLARATAQRTAEADAVRTASAILSGEARRARAEDVRSITRDSAALRTFRGVALVCGATATNLIVSYRGDRAPDLSKDSALAVSAGVVRAVAIRSVVADGAATCSDAWGGAPQLWRVDPHVPAGVLLVFESGNYYLTARALRYRLGAEGRQPLTADLFVHPPTGFIPGGSGALRYELATARGAPQRFSAWFPAAVP